jgi:hypothetical protein
MAAVAYLIQSQAGVNNSLRIGRRGCERLKSARLLRALPGHREPEMSCAFRGVATAERRKFAILD